MDRAAATFKEAAGRPPGMTTGWRADLDGYGGMPGGTRRLQQGVDAGSADTVDRIDGPEVPHSQDVGLAAGGEPGTQLARFVADEQVSRCAERGAVKAPSRVGSVTDHHQGIAMVGFPPEDIHPLIGTLGPLHA